MQPGLAYLGGGGVSTGVCLGRGSQSPHALAFTSSAAPWCLMRFFLHPCSPVTETAANPTTTVYISHHTILSQTSMITNPPPPLLG